MKVQARRKQRHGDDGRDGWIIPVPGVIERALLTERLWGLGPGLIEGWWELRTLHIGIESLW